jgi:hypothetical protein
MNAADLFLWAPTVGLLFIGAACVLYRMEGRHNGPSPLPRPAGELPQRWPRLWLLVRAWRLEAVRRALGLRNLQPCSCRQGLTSTDRLFMAQAVRGWVLVTGTALPEPSEDVDACFRLVRDLSQKLGQVQLFWAHPARGHHGWAKAKRGRVVRAYAWAGQTLWNQGPVTPEETVLGLQCFDYAADPESLSPSQVELVQANCSKVPQLAACWGLAWSELEQLVTGNACGVTGDPAKDL